MSAGTPDILSVPDSDHEEPAAEETQIQPPELADELQGKALVEYLLRPEGVEPAAEETQMDPPEDPKLEDKKDEKHEGPYDMSWLMSRAKREGENEEDEDEEDEISQWLATYEKKIEKPEDSKPEDKKDEKHEGEEEKIEKPEDSKLEDKKDEEEGDMLMSWLATYESEESRAKREAESKDLKARWLAGEKELIFEAKQGLLEDLEWIDQHGTQAHWAEARSAINALRVRMTGLAEFHTEDLIPGTPVSSDFNPVDGLSQGSSVPEGLSQVPHAKAFVSSAKGLSQGSSVPEGLSQGSSGYEASVSDNERTASETEMYEHLGIELTNEDSNREERIPKKRRLSSDKARPW